MGHLRVIQVERQRDEGLEAAGLILDLAHSRQVVDPVLKSPSLCVSLWAETIPLRCILMSSVVAYCDAQVFPVDFGPSDVRLKD
jgi:hypothetical protein